MKTLNAAGRFWFSYALLVIAGLIYSVHSHAGYFGTVLVKTGAMDYTGFVQGATSGCYLTPGMALMALSGGTQYYWVVTAMGSDGTWSAVSTTGAGGSVSGTFGVCQASPNVQQLPPMSGGVVDPAISGDSVLSGSGGGSSGGGDMEALFGWDAELFQLAITGSLLLFAVGFGIGLIVNAVRRARSP